MAYEELKRANARKRGLSEVDAVKETLKAPKSDGLVDMKRSKKEKGENTLKSPSDDPYPYNLRLHVENDEMDKLGLEDMTVGSEVTITAKAKITSCSVNDGEGGKHRSCSLQITKMKVS